MESGQFKEQRVGGRRTTRKRIQGIGLENDGIQDFCRKCVRDREATVANYLVNRTFHARATPEIKEHTLTYVQ